MEGEIERRHVKFVFKHVTQYILRKYVKHPAIQKLLISLQKEEDSLDSQN